MKNYCLFDEKENGNKKKELKKFSAMKTAYETLSSAIEGLKKKGFKEDFNLIENGVENKAKKQLIEAKNLNVVEVHRFEGQTNPDDSSVLYAIETSTGQKGLLVDAYGAYSDSISREMVEKLKIVSE
ncbi:hypothetical protein SAMN05216480_103208 [Pustulibacterium marinum]|uniref:Phosphoribosylpyrophosphate synthetase n=1 Tax=Pustulibacterium marinum TaxID=1224947 RepID=A0A1I7G601_9FLAO|nr:phosphoribosylpyrophosphate synthetase [Pustulibacterium marinum]SFU43781.1 hypothetical protein SAMN05216480_103208 [Pustulibacterium marinum]